MTTALAKIKDHTDVIASCSNFALNSAVFASKCFPKIPEIFPRFARCALSYTGIIWLNIQIREFAKCCKDAKYSFAAKDAYGVFYSAAKVALKGLEIFLTIATFAATLVALMNYGVVAAAIYTSLTPLAIPSILLPVFFDVTDYMETKRLLTQLEAKDSATVLRISAFAKDITKKTICSPEEKTLARTFVRLLDSYTLKERASPMVLTTLRTRLAISKVDIALRGYGYIGLGICRHYPNSLVQAGICWQASALYTAKLIWAKWEASRHTSI